MRLLVSLTFVALTAAPLPGQDPAANEGLSFLDTGPIRVREQFLLGMGYLALDPSSADVLARGHWQIDFVQSATNTWVHSDAVERMLENGSQRQPVLLGDLQAIQADGPGGGIYFADGEIYRSSLAIRHGIGHGLQLAVTIPILDFNTGVGDGIIESFHHTFGFDQSGRLGAPKGAYSVYLRTADGREVFRDSVPGTGLADVSVALKAHIPTGHSRWKLAVEGVVELPTGSERDLYSTGSVDSGVQILATRYFKYSCVHAGAGVVRAGAADVLGTDAQFLPSVFVGFEQALGKRTTALIQVTVARSPFHDLGIAGLDENAYLVDLGVKRGVSRGLVAFVAVSENMVNLGSSADVGLHFGITWTS